MILSLRRTPALSIARFFHLTSSPSLISFSVFHRNSRHDFQGAHQRQLTFGNLARVVYLGRRYKGRDHFSSLFFLCLGIIVVVVIFRFTFCIYERHFFDGWGRLFNRRGWNGRSRQHQIDIPRLFTPTTSLLWRNHVQRPSMDLFILIFVHVKILHTTHNSFLSVVFVIAILLCRHHIGFGYIYIRHRCVLLILSFPSGV
mmetsp:Transcript_12037/g.24406  ORF Transcript_12037/g.24406 Transcript_12037/m.24406 type:complete len:200 (+) Transcript_12037:470-1069(+)